MVSLAEEYESPLTVHEKHSPFGRVRNNSGSEGTDPPGPTVPGVYGVGRNKNVGSCRTSFKLFTNDFPM